ncbi:uncharacterized protein LOC118439504 [Folsomia candida]|uniref:uncharacterized protein LOC118439504 n=1 Tax=Folsomia candida TaxID=158441 RepID=UPI0016052602|nr:uncharacterized protein LOC118439504 [Folsomia candida]
MANRYFCIVILLAIGIVRVNGAKITCTASKKPNLVGVAPKFAKCLPYVNQHEGRVGRCVLEQISKPIDYPKSLAYLKSVLPEKQRKTVEKDLSPCIPKLKECKDSKSDPEGDSCTPVTKCFMTYLNKMCK